jgi:putative nucleotidyltransferase with HDIG domain
MDRQEVLAAIEARVKNPNLVKHMLASEAIMCALAHRLGQDEEEWGLTGLLHDIDVELTQDDFARHSKEGAELARGLGASEAMAHAILCHNEVHGVPRESLLDRALYSADPLTGLIVAAALVRPDRKLSALTAESVMKRFGEKRFAAGASREQMALCTELGLELGEFISLGLEAMQGIASELGL